MPFNIVLIYYSNWF